MGHDWIIDVLSDVRRFARQNDMPMLCAQLDDAIIIAHAEAAQKKSARGPWKDTRFAPADTRQSD